MPWTKSRYKKNLFKVRLIFVWWPKISLFIEHEEVYWVFTLERWYNSVTFSQVDSIKWWEIAVLFLRITNVLQALIIPTCFFFFLKYIQLYIWIYDHLYTFLYMNWNFFPWAGVVASHRFYLFYWLWRCLEALQCVEFWCRWRWQNWWFPSKHSNPNLSLSLKKKKKNYLF